MCKGGKKYWSNTTVCGALKDKLPDKMALEMEKVQLKLKNIFVKHFFKN